MNRQVITQQIARLLDYLEGSTIIDGYELVISDDPQRWALHKFDDQANGWSDRFTDLEVLAFVRGAFAAGRILDGEQEYRLHTAQVQAHTPDEFNKEVS